MADERAGKTFEPAAGVRLLYLWADELKQCWECRSKTAGKGVSAWPEWIAFSIPVRKESECEFHPFRHSSDRDQSLG